MHCLTADEYRQCRGRRLRCYAGCKSRPYRRRQCGLYNRRPDTEAEVIAALNTTNGKINSILAALETYGWLKTS
jgi:hypothetical protein